MPVPWTGDLHGGTDPEFNAESGWTLVEAGNGLSSSGVRLEEELLTPWHAPTTPGPNAPTEASEMDRTAEKQEHHRQSKERTIHRPKRRAFGLVTCCPCAWRSGGDAWSARMTMKECEYVVCRKLQSSATADVLEEKHRSSDPMNMSGVRTQSARYCVIT